MNIYSTWVLTDQLGRKAQTGQQVGLPRDKEVGLFYFLWHVNNRDELYDHTKSYNEKGVQGVWDMIPEGPLGYAHYWSEPHFGYYRSEDEWIVRKHCHMLAASGIDFIFFDTSNGLIYPKVSMLVFETFDKMQKEGVKVPKIIYFNGDNPSLNLKTITAEWELIYKQGKFKDLWYMVDNKPLMLCNPELVTDNEILDFFTMRRSWAFKDGRWYTQTEGKGCWPWADLYPQAPGLDKEGNSEQMIVMCGFWANGSNGRSFHNGMQPTNGKKDFEFSLIDTTTPLGLAFQEHFDYAKKIDPPRIMITGWNEWWAGRWEGRAAQGQTICNAYVVDTESDNIACRMHYVDNFNTEFSRDIEPMKGGFKDNYYCQMVKNIREYKGFDLLPLVDYRKTITCKEDFDSIELTFHDHVYDTEPRKCGSNGGNIEYVNNSGRNDIEYAKVSRDDNFTYFYVKTRDPLKTSDDTNWMNLYINTNVDGVTGWEGYSYLINRFRQDEKCSIEKTIKGWNWEKVGEAEIKYYEDSILITVPNELIGLGKVPVTFEFKWADNSVTDGDIMDFYDMGDAAPDGRFNFRYQEI